MADAIVSVVLEQLASVVGRQIQQEVTLLIGVDEEAEKLTSNFQTIQAVLLDAEQRQIMEAAVRIWLEKLKDVSYDMDNVLDEWNTAILQRLQLEGSNDAQTLKSKVRSWFFSPCFGLRKVVLHHDIALKIKAINDSLDVIAKQKDMFNFKLSTSMEQPQRAKTTSFVDVSEVFGRDEEKNTLISKVLCESSDRQNDLHVISIVGMGGIGKTTLAQLAFNNNEVMSNFEKRIWVCVSDPFEELRIAKAISEGLGGKCEFLELESVFQEIRRCIVGKKCLIVLDDVWMEDHNKWEPFHHCLKNSLHGSKFLVTTRKQTTALAMKSIDTISIEELSEEHCWSLFSQLAFFGRPDEEREKLENMGREIVRKCKGLPLAAKTMGSLLRFKLTRKEWESVLHSEMWKLKEFEKGVSPPLLLSYYDLSPMVKRCFTYCAIFPKDYGFKKDELIKLWMAQGYLWLKHNEEMELIGEEYFNSLAMRSFFQEFEKDDDGSIIRCKMHDIVHDVAQFLSKNECCMIGIDVFREENINVLCEKACHLRLMLTESDKFLSISNFKKLRSFLICGEIYISSKLFHKFLQKSFDKLTNVRTLEIKLAIHIPKEIGKLLHLRYLDLSSNKVLRKLPETLCELYNLQTLMLGRCNNLKALPQGIGKLINLRHLMNDDTLSLRYIPKGIERLTNLRTLSEFPLSGGDYGGKACSSLECFNNFRHLESFSIKVLENSTKVRNQLVQFKSNTSIRDLRLNFYGSGPMNADAIFEAFQPPPNLQRLTIESYAGETMSNLRMTSLTNLRWVCLNGCKKWVHLPPLGKLPFLETLIICAMYSVRVVGNEFLGVERDDTCSSSSSVISFPKLKTLQFWHLWDWELWDFGIEDHTTIMPSLRSLKIAACMKLKGLPKELLQMAPLQNLTIENCPILQQLYEKGKGDKWEDISNIPNIQIKRW